jgi:hypothetical protein
MLSPDMRWTTLVNELDDQPLVRVRCGHSHYVAAVFDTAIGPVFESLVGPRAHGDRDFVDILLS